MAIIAAKPFTVTNTTVTLGADDYTLTVLTAEFVPSAAVTAVTTVGGHTHQLAGRATWVLNLTFLQDFETAKSLSLYTLANEGATVKATIKPTATSPAYSADVILVPGNIGAAGNAVAQASIALPVSGRPTAVI